MKVSWTAICGSDLHLYDGYMGTMQKGDILGHEPMGEVVEAGRGVTTSRSATGSSCRLQSPAALYRLQRAGCFPVRELEPQRVDGPAGVGRRYRRDLRLLASHRRVRGRSGPVPAGQVRRRRSDEGRDGLEDEKVLFLSDVFPTGWMAAENREMKPGDTVAVWGCGPVGQFAIASAYLLGAERVIAIDRFGYRLRMAHEKGGAEIDRLRARGRSRDAARDDRRAWARCPASTPSAWRPTTTTRASTPTTASSRRRAWSPSADTRCARRSSPVATAARSRSTGVYGGFMDKFPIGAIMNRALTIRTGQCHVHRYLRPLLRARRERRHRPELHRHAPHERSTTRRPATRRSSTSRTSA